MKTSILALSTLLSLTTAHFELIAPKVRGFNEDLLAEYPCGGQNSVGARSEFPITDGSITIDLGHSVSNVEVLIAFGSSPGGAFNTIIKPAFVAQGLGSLCIKDLVFPAGMNITAGLNATLQVQSNGDPDGGLYNCANITFVNTLATAQSCPSSNIQIGDATVSGHPNGTAFGASGTVEEPSASSTVSGSATGATTTATQTPGAGSVVKASLGGLVLAGAAAFAVVL